MPYSLLGRSFTCIRVWRPSQGWSYGPDQDQGAWRNRKALRTNRSAPRARITSPILITCRPKSEHGYKGCLAWSALISEDGYLLGWFSSHTSRCKAANKDSYSLRRSKRLAPAVREFRLYNSFHAQRYGPPRLITFGLDQITSLWATCPSHCLTWSWRDILINQANTQSCSKSADVATRTCRTRETVLNGNRGRPGRSTRPRGHRHNCCGYAHQRGRRSYRRSPSPVWARHHYPPPL